jgi:membrane protease YdiL (CAAX protease family)
VPYADREAVGAVGTALIVGFFEETLFRGMLMDLPTGLSGQTGLYRFHP